MEKASNRFYNLWNKPMDEDWTAEEFCFLKKQIKQKKYTVNYAFYKKVSSSNKQIALIINTMPLSRRTVVENNWEIISSRLMTNSEIEEYINYYFRSSFKKFWVFYYQNIEKLINEDQKLKAVTPHNFIRMCQKRGYSGNYQTRIEFNTTCT